MEEKKFDIKSLIGFTLIFGILMWMMYSNQPTKEDLAEAAKKEQADKEAKTPKSIPAVAAVQNSDPTAKISPEAWQRGFLKLMQEMLKGTIQATKPQVVQASLF